MYCISSIDRKNVSLARAANGEALQKELELGSNRYNIITLMFFIPYIIFELPCEYDTWLAAHICTVSVCALPAVQCRLG
jgi:uncharacterized membrane protein (DUF485 family)